MAGNRKLVSRDLVVDGKALYDFLGDQDSIQKIIFGPEGIFPNEDVNNILDQLEERGDTDNVRDLSPALCGVDGFWVTKLLRAFIGRVRQGNEDHRCKFSGQIIEFDLTPSSPSTGEGRIVVDVVVETFNNKEQILLCCAEKKIFRWVILIKNYTIHKRTEIESDLFMNPFPTLSDFDFPTSALDPDNPSSVWCRCLNRKLYAKGEDLHIEEILCGPNESELEPLDKERNHCWYDVTETSCVDLMLKVNDGNLPTSIEDLFQVDGDYCLGRCLHPPVFNTGGT